MDEVGLGIYVTGSGGPDLTERLQRIDRLSWIDLGLLVAAVFVMTVKPG